MSRGSGEFWLEGEEKGKALLGPGDTVACRPRNHIFGGGNPRTSGLARETCPPRRLVPRLSRNGRPIAPAGPRRRPLNPIWQAVMS